MSKILVTGGAGFIGSCLVEQLIKNGHTVVVLDNLLTGRKENLFVHENLRFVKGDVNSWQNLSSLMLFEPFDYVFHYAAVVGVQRTLANPLQVLGDIEGFKNLLDLCKATKVKRVFFSSSSEVYGEPVEFPQNEETTPINSKLPYAIVKNVGEAFLKSYHKEHGLDYTVFRFFNTYGEKQSPDFVMSKFIRAALAGEDITIYGEGFQKRTFCHISDNIEATVSAFENDLFVNEVVNIGNEEEISIVALAYLVIKLTGSDSKIVHHPPLKEGDMTRRLPDVSKMKKLLNRPLVSIEEGVKKVLNGQVDNGA